MVYQIIGIGVFRRIDTIVLNLNVVVFNVIGPYNNSRTNIVGMVIDVETYTNLKDVGENTNLVIVNLLRNVI